ncbi:MAG: preprotein translocase subunit SecE [Patescibacteria group bacterium]
MNFFDKIKTYLKETISEVKKINWLSKKETIDLTLNVILFSLFFLIFFAVVDSLLIYLIIKIK